MTQTDPVQTIEREPNKKPSNNALKVAFTAAGHGLDPEEGLRRFLIQTKEQIDTDKSHFTEELFSDIFALIETGHIALEATHGSTKTLEEEPLMSGIAITSTAAAVYLLWSINSQRGEKEAEYRNALKMFVEFEKDLHNEENGETKEDRRQSAIDKLHNKMRHSGLQFVNLPDEQKKFNKSEFRAIAKDKGIGEPVTAGCIERCRSFLSKSPMEKVEVTGVALSRVAYHVKNVRQYASEYASNTLDKAIDLSHFAGHVMGEYLSNVPRTLRGDLNRTTTLGLKEIKALNDEMRALKKSEKQQDKLHHDNDQREDTQKEPLTLDQLKKVSLRSIHKLGHDWNQDEKDVVINKLRDREQHQSAAERAKRSFQVQLAFEALQLAMIPVKYASESHRHTIWMNVYSFFAAMGPLKGFAEQIQSERAKANSKQAEASEHVARILGIDAETKTSKELKEEQDAQSQEEEDFDPDYHDNDNDHDDYDTDSSPQP